MGLSIILAKQRDRTWYTSLDDVCGSVVFSNKGAVGVGRIVVYLEGINAHFLHAAVSSNQRSRRTSNVNQTY